MNLRSIKLPSSSPTGSSGQIQFNNAGAFGADSNLYWDNTNKRLAVGDSTSPTGKIHVFQNSDILNEGIKIENTGGTVGTMYMSSAGAFNYVGMANVTFFQTDLRLSDDAELNFGNGFDYTAVYDSSENDFRIVEGANPNFKIRFTIQKTTGNIGIGMADADYKLDVDGGIGLRAISTPADPSSDAMVLYQDEDTGDLMAKLNYGGTTKVATIADWSSL